MFFFFFSIYIYSSELINLGFFLEFQEKVGSWYSNPGTGTAESGAVGGGGGVGKYLKARNSQTESAAVDTSLTKKRKALAGEFKDFSAW